METCPQCKGKTKITVTVHAEGKKSGIELNCPTCDGKGEVTENKLKSYIAYQNMWCKCETPDDYPKYYADGEHPNLHKHHWRCRNCNKVVQLG